MLRFLGSMIVRWGWVFQRQGSQLSMVVTLSLRSKTPCCGHSCTRAPESSFMFGSFLPSKKLPGPQSWSCKDFRWTVVSTRPLVPDYSTFRSNRSLSLGKGSRDRTHCLTALRVYLFTRFKGIHQQQGSGKPCSMSSQLCILRCVLILSQIMRRWESSLLYIS